MSEFVIENGCLIKCKVGAEETEVTVPSGVVSIADKAFYCCSEIRKIVIPPSVREIGEKAFYACSSLESIVIPYGVKEIKDGTFLDCISLEEVLLPSSVTRIGHYAFSDCSYLGELDIPDSVTDIASDAFISCLGIAGKKDFLIRGGILFRVKLSLEEAVIPDGVEIITATSFLGCYGLKSIVIPESVKEISPDMFGAEIPDIEKIRIKDFSVLPEDYIQLAVDGFISDFNNSSSIDKDSCAFTLRQNPGLFMNEAIANIRLLEFILEMKCIDYEMTDLYLESAVSSGNVEASALLLAYRKNL